MVRPSPPAALTAGRLSRTLFERGSHSARIAEGSPYVIDVHSQANVPPVTRLITTDGRVLRTLVDNARVRENLEAMRLRAPEFTTVPGADGTPLRAYVIRPPDFETYTAVASVAPTYQGDGNWLYNWKTAKSLSGSCKLMTLELNDGSRITATFSFR